MEMSHIYDEDLLENKFFQQFCDICADLFESAVLNDWLICVPKVGTFESHTLTDLDCMSHVLIKLGPSEYKTATDKHVTITEKVISLEEGFETPKNVRVLFSETFYTDKQRKYQVWCIDQPLSFECLSLTPSLQAQSAEFRILNVDDSIELLFTGQDCSLKRTIDKMISTHRSALGISDKAHSNLRDLIDTMHSLFTKCLQACSRDSHLKRNMALNRHIADNLRISVETYINHRMHTDLFKYICTAVASDDAKLNKINRNMSQISLKDFGIVSEFSSNLPRARRELLTFVSYSTPLAKMASVKRVILALMQSPKNAQETEPLTADDLLPMLVFLIVRSSIPTWMANFEYMTQFHFSKSCLDDYSFYLSTLEAALFFINSGELANILNSNQSKNFDAGSLKSTSGSPKRKTIPQIDILFENIKCDDLDVVKELLEGTPESLMLSGSGGKELGASKCHPLCSCDQCEKNRDEEGTDPRSHVTVFSRDDRGYTAMHQAALFGRAQIIEYLKDCGGVVNSTDYHSSTPLHIACQRGHQSAVMMLIDRGANVNSTDNDGNRPLHMATLNGHEDCIKALLYQSEVIDINAANESGDTVLHLAAKWSYELITKILLEHGAWPEARNRRNATPMMLVSHGAIANLLTQAIEKEQESANYGFIEVLEARTSPQAQFTSSDITQQNIKPMTLAFEPQTKVSKKVKKFLRAVSDCDINMIRHLMGWNEPEYDSSDSCDDGGDVELCHPLCQCRKCAPTQRIQASLVDINAGDEQGRTAMHMAAERSNLEIMQMLISKHAEVNCKTNLVQFTPLHIACQQLSPDIKMVEMLLGYGAKVNCKDCNGRTPLHFSSQTGSIPITQLLLQSKANVNGTNVRGNTALHEACKVNNSDIVKLLLDYHTNPKIANKNGLTALQLTSDSRIVRLVTDALDKWRDEPEQIMSDVGNATQPDLSTPPAPKESVRSGGRSATLRRDLFTALETNDNHSLNQLLYSISTFNRRSLRRTITRDRSSPFFNIAAIKSHLGNTQTSVSDEAHSTQIVSRVPEQVTNDTTSDVCHSPDLSDRIEHVCTIDSDTGILTNTESPVTLLNVSDADPPAERDSCVEQLRGDISLSAEEASFGALGVCNNPDLRPEWRRLPETDAVESGGVGNEHPECDLMPALESSRHEEVENSSTESADEHTSADEH